MTLSPAAQAVSDAFVAAACKQQYKMDAGIGAALRTAVVQCRYIGDDDSLIDGEKLLAIATELENRQ